MLSLYIFLNINIFLQPFKSFGKEFHFFTPTTETSAFKSYVQIYENAHFTKIHFPTTCRDGSILCFNFWTNVLSMFVADFQLSIKHEEQHYRLSRRCLCKCLTFSSCVFSHGGFSVSPILRFSVSPFLRFSVSPILRFSASPILCFSVLFPVFTCQIHTYVCFHVFLCCCFSSLPMCRFYRSVIILIVLSRRGLMMCQQTAPSQGRGHMLMYKIHENVDFA